MTLDLIARSRVNRPDHAVRDSQFSGERKVVNSCLIGRGGGLADLDLDADVGEEKVSACQRRKR